jgi:hypothetical protein
MKRILALAAVMTGLLAIPTAAMASTSGSGWSGPGSGYGSGTTVSIQQPYTCYYGFHRVHHHSQRYFDWWRHGRQYTAVTCPYPRQVALPQPLPNQPLPNQCVPQTLTFSVAAGSSTMTEVSGPQLSAAEQFTYGGSTYTVMSVNSGAGQFTAFVDNSLYTNNGADITAATAALCCS